MLIINADDWGRSKEETDIALEMHRMQMISSVSTMLFMNDSKRAAKIAIDNSIDVGLHLNLSENLQNSSDNRISICHKRIVKYYNNNKYSVVFYNPFINNDLKISYKAHIDKFRELYGKYPSHINGHQHMHLNPNILLHKIIDKNEKVRPSFTFINREKIFVNRCYRKVLNNYLKLNYKVVNYFFSLMHLIENNLLKRAVNLSLKANVEIMTHPIYSCDREGLSELKRIANKSNTEIGTYSSLVSS